jgi:hypothetical protein
MSSVASFAASGGGLFGGVYLVVWLAVAVLYVASWWTLFVKAGKPGWAAIIPIYNVIVLLDIIGRPVWWVILYFVPVVNWIIALIVSIDVAKAFGKSAAFGIGLWLLGFVFYPILAFGDTRYQGSAAGAGRVAPGGFVPYSPPAGTAPYDSSTGGASYGPPAAGSQYVPPTTPPPWATTAAPPAPPQANYPPPPPAPQAPPAPAPAAAPQQAPPAPAPAPQAAPPAPAPAVTPQQASPQSASGTAAPPAPPISTGPTPPAPPTPPKPPA